MAQELRQHRSVLAAVLLAIGLVGSPCLRSRAMPVSSGTPGEAWEVRKVLEGLEEKMENVESIQTNFTQTKQVSMLKHAIVLEGFAYMHKPDRFAWHTQTPVRNSIVLKDNMVYQWNEETDEVETLSVSDAPVLRGIIDQTQTWFYGSYLAMLDEYVVRILARTPLTLEFRPHAGTRAAAILESVRIRFKTDQSYIESIRFVEKSGTQSSIEFTGTVLNGKLDESVWEIRRNPG